MNLPQKPAARPAHNVAIEQVKIALSSQDLDDLCLATEQAIAHGGGFGWVSAPSRESLARYWQGVVTMPARILMVVRLDQMVCGAAQLVKPPQNNEAQSFAVQLMGLFLAPWARGHGLGAQLLQQSEDVALRSGFGVINLDVRETQHSAIRLFEQGGYEPFGRHPCYARIGDNIIPGRYYTKIIDPHLLK